MEKERMLSQETRTVRCVEQDKEGCGVYIGSIKKIESLSPNLGESEPHLSVKSLLFSPAFGLGAVTPPGHI